MSWDPVAEKIFGWSNDHAVGRCLADLFTVVSLDGSHPHVDAGGILTALTGEGSWSGSVTSKCASDSLGQSLVAVSSSTNSEGTVTGYFAVCTPIAQQESHSVLPQDRLEESGPSPLDSERDKFWRVFVESPVGTALVGTDARIVDVNRALCRSLGMTRDEAIGENFVEFTHPDDRDLEVDYAQRLFDGKIDRFQIDRRFRRSDGSTMTGRITASAVRDVTGRVAFGIGVVEDVTERLRSDSAHLESEKVFRRTIEASNDAFVGVDSSGRVTDWNAAAERLFGWNTNEAIGRLLMSMVVPEERTGVTQTL